MKTWIKELLILIVAATNAYGIDWSSCDANVARGDGRVCYKMNKVESTFDAAVTMCQANGQLASISSAEENSAISKLLNERFIGEAWIGLKQEVKTWRWPDASELSEQGCFTIDPSETAMVFMEDKDDNSFSTCSNICLANNYKYVGLKNGTKCYCGNTVGTAKQVGVCNIHCPGSSSEYCGGQNTTRIVAINGAYTNWIPGLPSGGESASENQMCSILRKQEFQWLSFTCDSSYPAICEIGLSPENFPTCDTSKMGVHLLDTKQNPACIYVPSQSLTSFEAEMSCFNMNGSLIKISSSEQEQALKDIITENYPQITEFWIGAKRFNYKWNSGEKVSFTSFKTPDFSMKSSCGFVKKSSDSWQTADCSARKYVICESTNATYSSKPTFFTASTTTTAPSVVTKIIIAPPSTTLPHTNLTVPDNAGGQIPKNTNNNNTTVYIIVGSVIGGSLLLIVLTIIITVVICRKKRPVPKTNLHITKSIQPSYFFGIDIDDGTLPPKTNPPSDLQHSIVIQASAPPSYTA